MINNIQLQEIKDMAEELLSLKKQKNELLKEFAENIDVYPKEKLDKLLEDGNKAYDEYADLYPKFFKTILKSEFKFEELFDAEMRAELSWR